jgi:hypothetical protein
VLDVSIDLSTQQAEKLRGLATTRELNLDSSLSPGMALQPSSTAVYTAVLNVKRPLLRPPSKFRLQISIVYSLAPSDKDSPTFVNTIAYEITIRPALKSLLFGTALGGMCGSVGRMLQIGGVNLEQVTWSSSLSFLLSILLAVLLSAIAIIFMARKSDAQPFISVEDFWGGLLIGFLVGYTGTSFFSELTHIERPKSAV